MLNKEEFIQEFSKTQTRMMEMVAKTQKILQSKTENSNTTSVQHQSVLKTDFTETNNSLDQKNSFVERKSIQI